MWRGLVVAVVVAALALHGYVGARRRREPVERFDEWTQQRALLDLGEGEGRDTAAEGGAFRVTSVPLVRRPVRPLRTSRMELDQMLDSQRFIPGHLHHRGRNPLHRHRRHRGNNTITLRRRLQGFPHRVEARVLAAASGLDESDTFGQTSGLTASNRSIPLYGGLAALGEYYVHITLTGRAKRGEVFRVQVDTGSSTLAVPLSSCVSCRKEVAGNLATFHPNPSQVVPCSDPQCKACADGEGNPHSRHENRSCGFWLSYGDKSSASGSLYNADIRFTDDIVGSKAVGITFGGVEHAGGYFEHTGVDGIMGLAYAPLACNPSCIRPVWDAMIAQRAYALDVFSLCVVSEPPSTSHDASQKSGGVLALGGVDPRTIAHGESIRWTRIIPSVSSVLAFYMVPLVEHATVRLSSERAAVEKSLSESKARSASATFPWKWKRAIVDSGTTLTVLSPEMFARLRNAVLEVACVRGSGSSRLSSVARSLQAQLCAIDWFRPASCFQVPASLQPYSEKLLRMILPDVEFRMSVAEISGSIDKAPPSLLLSPVDYLIAFKHKGRTFRCVGFMILEDLDDQRVDAIFGLASTMKYVTVYDRERQLIGFARSAPSCQRDLSAPTTGAGCAALGDDCSRCREASRDCMWLTDSYIQAQRLNPFMNESGTQPRCASADWRAVAMPFWFCRGSHCRCSQKCESHGSDCEACSEAKKDCMWHNTAVVSSSHVPRCIAADWRARIPFLPFCRGTSCACARPSQKALRVAEGRWPSALSALTVCALLVVFAFCAHLVVRRLRARRASYSELP